MEASGIKINYGPPQSSLLGGGTSAKQDESLTEIAVSESESAQTFCLLKFDSFLNIYSLINRYVKQVELP